MRTPRSRSLRRSLAEALALLCVAAQASAAVPPDEATLRALHRALSGAHSVRVYTADGASVVRSADVDSAGVHGTISGGPTRESTTPWSDVLALDVRAKARLGSAVGGAFLGLIVGIPVGGAVGYGAVHGDLSDMNGLVPIFLGAVGGAVGLLGGAIVGATHPGGGQEWARVWEDTAGLDSLRARAAADRRQVIEARLGRATGRMPGAEELRVLRDEVGRARRIAVVTSAVALKPDRVELGADSLRLYSPRGGVLDDVPEVVLAWPQVQRIVVEGRTRGESRAVSVLTGIGVGLVAAGLANASSGPEGVGGGATLAIVGAGGALGGAWGVAHDPPVDGRRVIWSAEGGASAPADSLAR